MTETSASGRDLGLAWVDHTGDPAYRLQVSDAAARPAGPWSGMADRAGVAAYGQTMLFNDHQVAGVVSFPGADDIAILHLRANDSNQVVLAAYNSSRWVIGTNTGPYSLVTDNLVEQVESGVAVTLLDQDEIKFEARGNVYIGYLNDVEVVRWADQEGVYAPYVDAAHHEVAIEYLWGTATTGGWETWSADDLYVWPSMVGTTGSGTLEATATGEISFIPFTEENLPQTDAPIPPGAGGCYVTLLGSGGGGGIGHVNLSGDRGGGGGGGGAAKVHRVFVPVTALGLTYTVACPPGGLSQANGGDATFISGGVSLIAGGGGKGGNGTASAAGVAGAGGVGSATGVTTTVDPGGPGGTGGGENGDPGVSASNMSTGGAPGGGGGSGMSGTGATDDSGAGGNSATVAGGAVQRPNDGEGNPGTSATTGLAGGGGGGASSENLDSSGKKGGDAGDCGGGGGGGMGGNANGTNGGGIGGDSYTKIEWVRDEFSEENTPVTDKPVPAGKTGCYVTLIGAGGGGGIGHTAMADARGGGGGGGGAAKVDRIYIPVASLGPTYTVVRPLGGVSQVAGAAASFTSGAIVLTAGGGGPGGNGSKTLGGTAGISGTGTATGIAATVLNGTTGGEGGDPNSGVGFPGVDNPGGGAPGGGGACGYSALAFAGRSGKGGDSATALGGASNNVNDGDGNPGWNAGSGMSGGGGAGATNESWGTDGTRGGDGGKYGAGGGGGMGGVSTGLNAGGTGGDSYTMVEWI